jgi:MFS family permease
MRHRERWAVSALFFTNGALFASLLPRLPEIKSALDLSAGQLGLALLGVGLGGLIGSLATRWLLPRVHSRRAGVGATLVLAAGLPLVGLAPSAWVLFAVFVGYGIADGVGDVSTNVAGVEAQRRLGRSVLNSMHGAWSIGAVLAGATGSAAAGLGVPLALHLGAVAVLCAVLALLAARSVPAVTGEGATRAAGQAPARFSPALALLCALAVLAALVEAAPYSWSAVYLAEHTGAGPGIAGLGFTAFVTGMVAARLVADKLVEKWGPVPVVRIGGLAGGLALAAALALGGTAPGIVAFAVMGLGSAAVFPAMITAAGAMPGQAVQAMNMATRVGFLAAPPLVGLLADGVGLPSALGLLIVPAALGLAVFAGAVAVKH